MKPSLPARTGRANRDGPPASAACLRSFATAYHRHDGTAIVMTRSRPGPFSGFLWGP